MTQAMNEHGDRAVVRLLTASEAKYFISTEHLVAYTMCGRFQSSRRAPVMCLSGRRVGLSRLDAHRGGFRRVTST
jgi:hypothetical protein